MTAPWGAIPTVRLSRADPLPEVTAWHRGLPAEARCGRCGQEAMLRRTPGGWVLGPHYTGATDSRGGRLSLLCPADGAAVPTTAWDPAVAR